MTSERLQDLLDQAEVDYATVAHAEAFTAQEAAAASHVTGWEIAKAVVVRDRMGRFRLAVFPAPCRLDLGRLGQAVGDDRLRLATESELAERFPDCEVGAMPPIGRLYGMPTYLDACLPRSRHIYFSAGTHRELISLRYDDYVALARPILGEFCFHASSLSKTA